MLIRRWTILGFLERWPAWLRAVLILAGVVLLGVLDYLTGFEISFAFFYLVPVAVASWSLGRFAGLVVSALSAVTWLAANRLAGDPLAQTVVLYWNGVTRLGFFAVVTLLMTRLRELIDRERWLSRTDSVTGALNGRAYSEASGAELSRARRYGHPLTVAYIDLDNFKSVNDRFGHSVGDALLREVVQIMRSSLRASDVVARLGGDEFAVLLPEADRSAATGAVEKLRANLLAAMQQRGWPVTFSIGVLTCHDLPESTDGLIAKADHLMYEVKRTSKNAVAYAEYEGPR